MGTKKGLKLITVEGLGLFGIASCHPILCVTHYSSITLSISNITRLVSLN